MSIRVHCPVCGYRIKAPDGAYGRRGVCPRCKLMIRLPTQAELEAEADQASPPGIPSADASSDESGWDMTESAGSDDPQIIDDGSALEFHVEHPEP